MRYYNTRKSFLVDSFSIMAEEIEIIDEFLQLLEESGVCEIIENTIKKNIEKGGRPPYNSYNMLAAILFCSANKNYTLREIAVAVKYDIRALYIMNGETPTYKTIGNFINDVILPNTYLIFSKITKYIFKKCNINMDVSYVDGSKFEANANKYKFVWKPTTFHKKLSIKIRKLLAKYKLDSDLPSDEILSSKIISEKISNFNELIKSKSLSTKDYDLLCEYLEKGLEYEEKERICGPNRKSYYKTDHDATAMCLKEDYYSGLGSNMHAAYSVQISTSYGFITCFTVGQSRTDYDQIIPLFDKYYEIYNEYPKKVTAYSAYGTYNTLKYLKEKNIIAFVKHQSWEGNISGRHPTQYKINSENKNEIICLNNQIGRSVEIEGRHPKSKRAKFYKITGCSNCLFSVYCKRFQKDKTSDEKKFEVDIEFKQLIDEAEQLLLSVEGIEMRVNRSIFVEGAFGILKQDFYYDRFRRRSLEKAKLEFMIMCLSLNVRKFLIYLNKKDNYTFKCWKAPEGTKPQVPKKTSAKRLTNRVNKKTPKSVNQASKDSYKYAKNE